MEQMTPELLVEKMCVDYQGQDGWDGLRIAHKNEIRRFVKSMLFVILREIQDGGVVQVELKPDKNGYLEEGIVLTPEFSKFLEGEKT